MFYGYTVILITHRFNLEDAEEAFRIAGDKLSKSIKVVFDPLNK